MSIKSPQIHGILEDKSTPFPGSENQSKVISIVPPLPEFGSNVITPAKHLEGVLRQSPEGGDMIPSGNAPIATPFNGGLLKGGA